MLFATHGRLASMTNTDDTDTEDTLTDEQRAKIEADPVLEVSDFIDGEEQL